LLNQIKKDLKKAYPPELVDALIDSYVEIKEHYYLDRLEPSELNGGKFVEAAIRIIQFVTNNRIYTPIGTTINDIIGTLRKFEQIPDKKILESYRIHIPRNLCSIYNIRNKRGVGHLGGDINPNLPDANMIIACCDWVLAELFSINYNCSLDQAQKMVDILVQRKNPLVYEFEDIKRVLNPELSFKIQTLLLLANSFPKRVDEENLIKWIEPKNTTDYRRKVLKPMHDLRFIDYIEKQSCLILPPGLKFIDEHIEEWSKF
jgi:hypothetical protein